MIVRCRINKVKNFEWLCFEEVAAGEVILVLMVVEMVQKTVMEQLGNSYEDVRINPKYQSPSVSTETTLALSFYDNFVFLKIFHRYFKNTDSKSIKIKT
jgi:Flp pilus assembly secretin CpaC